MERRPVLVAEREEPTRRFFDAPFAKMPREVSLPAIGAGPIDLGRYATEIAASELRLDLVSPEYLTRGNKHLFVHRHREANEEVRWLVFDEPESVMRTIQSEGDTGGTTPIAMLRAKDGRLSFAWLSDATSQAHAERLQQCVCCVSMGDTIHKLQLRKPVDEPSAIVIDNWEEKHEFQISIDSIPNFPPAAEVFLRLHLLDGWPRSQPVNGNPERLAADERLLLSFSQVDYAGLGLYWEAKGKVIAVSVAPGFRLASYPDELQILSRTRLERAEKRLDRDKREAAREYSRRIKLRPRLSSNLETARNINITIPGGGTTVQLRNQKNAAISAAQTEINANEARISALNRLATFVAEDEKSRIPSLRSLANQLEGTAKLGFELYTTVGNGEVVIYRKGIADLASSKEASHDARSLSTQSAPESNHPLSSSGL